MVVIPISIIYFFISIYFKINSKFLAVFSLILIVVVAGILMLEDVELANSLATIVFYLLIVTVALVIVESYRDMRRTEKDREGEEG
jgi:hypothetical protein